MPKKAYVSSSGVHSFTSHQAGFTPSHGKQHENSFSTNQSRLDQYVVFSLLNFRNRRTKNFTNQIYSNTCGNEQLALLLSPRNTSHLHTFTFFTWRLSHHPHWSHSFIAGALSFHASFHSALSFNGQSDAEEDQHQGVGQESNGEGTSNQLPSDGGKDGSDDSTKESQVEELLHSVGDTKVHKTGQNHAFNTAAISCQYEDIYHFIARRMDSF